MRRIDFLVYSRSAGVEPDRSLTEEHWSYMDRFADDMTARGPTLTPDRETWTGSLHIVDLPSADAAAEFVEREPYNRAGMFDGHLVRRFDNLLGRTMWEFPRDSDDPAFLVLAHPRAAGGEPGAPMSATVSSALAGERVVVLGETSTPDGMSPAGFASVLQAPTREAVDVIVERVLADLDETFDVEVHDWEFGGRR